MPAIYDATSCDYYARKECGSCSLLGEGSTIGSARKFSEFVAQLHTHHPSVMVDALWSPISLFHSRAKAKLAISGSSDAPRFGFIDRELNGVDLRNCPLHLPLITQIVNAVSGLITRHKLHPFDVKTRVGELKAIIVSCNRSQTEAMVRFVLRSRELESRVRVCAADLQKMFSQVTVMSLNIQPIPAAILEGPEEYLITDNEWIVERYSGINIAFAPQAFMQVTPETAEALYDQGREWLREHNIKTLLDLYCGAGGFSLTSASALHSACGVEISESAVKGATYSCSVNNISNVTYLASPVDLAISGDGLFEGFDGVVVNPPRRGLDESVRRALLKARPKVILYSSCNPQTWLRDISILAQEYTLERVRPFDMFVLTEHLEILSLLTIKDR